MSDLIAATERTREILRGLLKKVPQTVNEGSHQTAVVYKKLAIEGQKLLASMKAKYSALQQVTAQLSMYR